MAHLLRRTSFGPFPGGVSYYATVAEGWFGVPHADVISGGTPIAGIFG